MKRVILFIALFISTNLFAQTKFEKDFFHLTNLVRSNPKYVATLIQKESDKIGFDKDSLKVVIDILNKLPKVDSLVFDSTIYNNMEENHGSFSPNDNIKITTTFNLGTNHSVKKDTIVVKRITHNHDFLTKYNYGENIVSYDYDELTCLVLLLVDRGWYVSEYKCTHTNKNFKPEYLPSLTHKPHFDNIIDTKYKKTAVRVSVGVDGNLYVFQDFSN